MKVAVLRAVRRTRKKRRAPPRLERAFSSVVLGGW